MTTKITTANIADNAVTTAKIAGGGVDLSSIQSDILKLALHQAIDGNRAAFNLTDSFIDGFEDDTGITTETTVDRDTSGEYVSTTVSSTVNATGTLISDPQTASTSRTSASGVIIYEDAGGTNTLGTDLKVYFSCNNSAWTEAASYGTATTYSGTKKLVKLGATTCTAGTSIAMKAEWANQSAPSTTIADDAGTIIGDFTTNPSNAFNNTVSTRANSAQRSTSTNAYIGKDLGAGNGRPITGASWDRPTDADSMDSSSTMTTYLYASNSAPTSYNDGTLLGTIGTETNNTSTSQMSKLDFSNSTTYRYVWIHASSPESNNFWCAEAKFYGTDLTSKEARLHGWAVNY